MTTRKSPPGPSPNDGLGTSEVLRADPLAGFLALERDFGPVVRVQEEEHSWYLVTHPPEIQHILQDNGQNYRKNLVASRSLAPLLGEGLLTSEGPSWQRQRRIAQPSFHRQRVLTQVSKIAESTRVMLGRWEEHARRGTEIDLDAELVRLTVEIVGQTLFSLDLGDESAQIAAVLSASVDRHAAKKFANLVGASEESFFADSSLSVTKLVDDILDRRKAEASTSEDFLSHMMALQDQEQVTDREVREGIVTMLFTGYETCSKVLAWTWYLLAENRAVEASLRDEVREVMGRRPPQAEDLPRLKLASQIISEVMRLYPPVWSFGRRPLNRDRIGGYDIPANALVVLSPYVTHRLPSHWARPDRFDPARFSAEATAERSRYVYFPFGGGQRHCIGHHLALLEAQVILAMVSREFTVRLSRRHEVVPEAASILRSRGGVRATVHRA